MNVIVAYLDTMFSAYPSTPRMVEAKAELHAMMEDAYTSLIAQGNTENEAVGQVIRDFGNLEEIAPVLGISSDIGPGAVADAATQAALGQASAGQASVAQPSATHPAVTLAEAEPYVAAERVSARRVAMGVVLFVLSPIALIVLVTGAESGAVPWSEGAASLAGMLVLLALVAIGVLLCVSGANATAPHARLKDGQFSPSPEVTAWAHALSAQATPSRNRALLIAITLWILAAVPVITASLLTEDSAHADFWAGVGVGLTLVMVAAGLGTMLPHAWSTTVTETLTEGGNRTASDDDETSIVGIIAAFYWPLLTAGFLAWGFIGDAWDIAWIVWPIGGVLFGAIAGGIGALEAYRKKR